MNITVEFTYWFDLLANAWAFMADCDDAGAMAGYPQYDLNAKLYGVRVRGSVAHLCAKHHGGV